MEEGILGRGAITNGEQELEVHAIGDMRSSDKVVRRYLLMICLSSFFSYRHFQSMLVLYLDT